MAHGADKKREARKAYVFQRQSMPTISLTLGVSVATLGRWKKDAKSRGDDWDVARSAHMIAGDGLEAVVAAVVEDFVVLFQASIEQLKNDDQMPADHRVKHMAALSDAFNKMVAAAGRVSPKISELGVANDVIKRLAEFIRAHYPQHAAAFLEILEPFGDAIVEAYS